MSFWDIPPQVLLDIKGALPAISAAEMLEQSQPQISASLATYALQLIDNVVVTFGESPELSDARQKILAHVAGKQLADTKMLDRFGSSLYMAAESSPNKSELMGLAYLAYAASSIHGPMKKSVMQRLLKAEKGISPESVSFTPSSSEMPPSGAPSSFVPSTPPPSQPQSDMPSQEPPSQFPPWMYQQGDESTDNDDPKAQKLATIARDSFKAGAYDIALTAMLALVKELEVKINE